MFFRISGAVGVKAWLKNLNFDWKTKNINFNVFSYMICSISKGSVYRAFVNVFFRISGAVGLKAGLENLKFD